MSDGIKYDGGKARLDLLPPELLFGVAEILDFGARKYSARNWEKGMDWSRVFGALMRHMWAWWRGDGVDPETGKSHLWHAGCCIAFLIAYEQRKVGKDDRPITAVPGSSSIQEPDDEPSPHIGDCFHYSPRSALAR